MFPNAVIIFLGKVKKGELDNGNILKPMEPHRIYNETMLPELSKKTKK